MAAPRAPGYDTNSATVCGPMLAESAHILTSISYVPMARLWSRKIFGLSDSLFDLYRQYTCKYSTISS